MKTINNLRFSENTSRESENRRRNFPLRSVDSRSSTISLISPHPCTHTRSARSHARTYLRLNDASVTTFTKATPRSHAQAISLSFVGEQHVTAICSSPCHVEQDTAADVLVLEPVDRAINFNIWVCSTYGGNRRGLSKVRVPSMQKRGYGIWVLQIWPCKAYEL